MASGEDGEVKFGASLAGLTADVNGLDFSGIM